MSGQATDVTDKPRENAESAQRFSSTASTNEISVQTLSRLRDPDFCPRCFWLGCKVRSSSTPQPSAVIASFAQFAKMIVHGWFDDHQCTPPWMGDVNSFSGYDREPVGDRDRFADPSTGLTLRGQPDDVLIDDAQNRVLVDYRLGWFPKAADPAMHTSCVQLLASAFIWQQRREKPASRLLLIYLDPLTNVVPKMLARFRTKEGFNVLFRTHVLHVEHSYADVPCLMGKAARILNAPRPPEPKSTCKDCRTLGEMVKWL